MFAVLLLVTAAVLTLVESLSVAGGVNLRVAQVCVQLIDDRRTHANKVQLTDVERMVVYVEHV